MLHKTTGIVLRILPYSQTSALILMQTPDEGLLRALAKGAFRPRSLLLGQFDTAYCCELVFHRRHPEHLALVREMYPLASYDGLRRSWRHAFAACLACRLAQAIEPQPATPALFEALKMTLEWLASGGARCPHPLSALWWYEAAVLRFTGHAPRLDACARCGRKARVTFPSDWSFLASVGGMTCPACVQSGNLPRAGFDIATAEALARVFLAPAPAACGIVSSEPKERAAIDETLAELLAAHLDVALPNRADLAWRLRGELARAAAPERLSAPNFSAGPPE